VASTCQRLRVRHPARLRTACGISAPPCPQVHAAEGQHLVQVSANSAMPWSLPSITVWRARVMGHHLAPVQHLVAGGGQQEVALGRLMAGTTSAAVRRCIRA
jgi:hypothetical protein